MSLTIVASLNIAVTFSLKYPSHQALLLNAGGLSDRFPDPWNDFQGAGQVRKGPMICLVSSWTLASYYLRLGCKSLNVRFYHVLACPDQLTWFPKQ